MQFPVRKSPRITYEVEPSVQLGLESGTIYRRTSDSRTCQTAVSDSRWLKTFLGAVGPQRSVNPPLKRDSEITLRTYLLTFELAAEFGSI